MPNKVSKYLLLFAIAGFILALDQYTKHIVRLNLAIGEVWSPWEWFTPYARFVHWHNTGAAFGLFQGFSNIFVVLSIVVAAVILYYYPRIPQNDWALRIALSMQLGGALGNLTDRIRIGHVTDFISVGTFPVFNIADASISIGVAVLIISMWIQEKKEKQEENPTELANTNGETTF